MKMKLILILVFLFILLSEMVFAAETTLPVCDLGAEMINYDIVKRLDASTVRVKITAKVKNLGATDYISGKNQTIALLSEESSAQENGFVVKVEKEIPALPAGDFFVLEYERDWAIVDLEVFSGSPSYLLEIKYAPELLQDGNPGNDDTVSKNNKRERTSKELRRIWNASPLRGAK